jgi:ribosomal protein S12 methylthiotransferase accessory factor YcaO
MTTESFIAGKDASKLAVLASALGEFFERLSCNHFCNQRLLAACAKLHPEAA